MFRCKVCVVAELNKNLIPYGIGTLLSMSSTQNKIEEKHGHLPHQKKIKNQTLYLNSVVELNPGFKRDFILRH